MSTQDGLSRNTPESLEVPPLRSGGVMLSYQCPQECGHCSYRSGPAPSHWMTDEVLGAALDALARERRLVDIHLGGGEPTLRPDLLEGAVRKIRERNIRLSYLETSGFFAATLDKALDMFRPLKEAGLDAVLVSVSPYHNETIPFSRTMNCLRAAEEVFGADSVFPWLSHFIPMLSAMDPDVPHDLDEFLAVNRVNPDDGELLRLFPLTPGGRVPERLGRFFRKRPADDFRGGHCLEMLTSTEHFHIDPYGNLFTGHCPGIVSGRVPDRLHEPKTFDLHPVFVTLALGGPHALMEIARRFHGFVPDGDGYISPCDLCNRVRRFLFKNDPEGWPELGPAPYYR